MQKYSTPAIVPGSGAGQNTAEAIFGSVDVYLAADVDIHIAELKLERDGMVERIAEMEKAHERYEKVRKLNSQEFTALYQLSIERDLRFDDLVDGLSG